jgi:hypothetical protein
MSLEIRLFKMEATFTRLLRVMLKMSDDGGPIGKINYSKNYYTPTHFKCYQDKSLLGATHNYGT